jgi:hypothetical protein
MNIATDGTWVVYQMTVSGKHTGLHAVCSMSEWERMETGRPGYHTLVRQVVGSEGDAERYARGLQLLPEPEKRGRAVARLPDRLPQGHGCGPAK